MKKTPLLLFAAGLSFLMLSGAPRTSATLTRFIQIVKEDDVDTRFHLAEIEAFAVGVVPNEDGVEFDGQITSTNDIGDGELTTYGDGEFFPDIGTTDALEHGGAAKDPNNELELAGAVWSTANNLGENAQYTLDLGEEVDVTTVRLWPRADTCCSNRWMNLVINLYGDNGGEPGELNATAMHTDNEGNIALEFTFAPSVDSDGDGMPDGYETAHGLDPDVDDSELDLDGDTITNLDEYENGTLPEKRDTDEDGLDDNVETGTGTFVDASNTGTNPLDSDSDDDKLLDGAETGTGTFVSAEDAGSDPNNPDTDDDGFRDGLEVAENSDPTNADSVPAADIPPPLAFYDFEDADISILTDGSGNGYDGDVNGNVTLGDGAPDGSTPTRGGRFSFDEEAGFVDVGGFDWFELIHEAGDGDYTLACWLKPDVESLSGDRFIWGQTSQGVHNGVRGSGTLHTAHWGADSNAETPLEEDEWVHAVWVYNGADDLARIYLNGVLDLEDFSQRAPNGSGNLILGGRDGGTANFVGCLDDMAIWAQALREDQVAVLAAGESPATAIMIDSDEDGMPDYYEEQNELNNAANDAAEDKDGDGLTNLQEYELNLKANNADTDGDTLNDKAESNTGTWVSAEDTGTNPRKIDTDGDGLADNVETNTKTFVSADDTGTDPNKIDSDGDTFSDSRELNVGSDPTDPASFPQPPVGGLIAYWDFNDASTSDEAVDLVGGLSGDVTADYTEDGGGRTGEGGDYAMDFATGGSVLITDVEFLEDMGAVDQMTVSLWQKNEGTPSSSSFWITADGFDRAAQAHIPWNNGIIYFDTGGGCCAAGSQRLNFTPSDQEGLEDFDFLDDEWHHYAFVKDTELKQVWIDGVLAFETEGADPLPLDSYINLNIGSADNGAQPAAALIDDFAIYAVPLAPEQIVELAEGGTPGGGGSLPFQIIGVNRLDGSNAEVTWESKAGRSYSIDYTSELTENGWIEGTDGFEAEGDTATYEDSTLTPEIKERYYRVRAE